MSSRMGPIYQHGFTLIPAWLSNCVHYEIGGWNYFSILKLQQLHVEVSTVVRVRFHHFLQPFTFVLLQDYSWTYMPTCLIEWVNLYLSPDVVGRDIGMNILSYQYHDSHSSLIHIIEISFPGKSVLYWNVARVFPIISLFNIPSGGNMYDCINSIVMVEQYSEHILC